MDHRPPKLQKDYALEFAHSALGFVKWSTWKVGLLIILFPVLLNLVSSSVYDVFNGQFHCSHLVYFLLFLLVTLFLLGLVEEAAARVNLDIVQTDSPPPCQVLILFLSPPGKDEQWLQQPLKDEMDDISNGSTRKRFEGSWRMPVEAVAYHLTRLERIVVLPSSDSPDKMDGTFRYFSLFAETMKQLTQTKKSIQIIGLHEIDSRWDKGVDYEVAQALVDALHQTSRWLHDQGVKDQDILVDITGGQKVPTVAGAAVALGKGRWFQYISTRDYKVRAYDITYRAATDF